MTVTILRGALTIAACFGLWRVWRSIARVDPRVAWIVGGGFLLRALGGQALFWISLLRLPVGRSLQLGDGFWFFAIDGPWYLANAYALAQKGPAAVLFADATYASHTFVQILAPCLAAFGPVASVAILVNCAAFLATCIVIVRLGTREGRAGLPCLAALAAVAFGPGTILWSLQLLKDTIFLLCIALIAGACRRWEDLWRATPSPDTRRRLAGCALAMCALLFALAGMRWYAAAFVWGAFGVVFVPVFVFVPADATRRRRAAALAASAALFVVLGHMVRLGGADDIPRPVARVLDLRAAASVVSWPSKAVRYLTEIRGGFDTTPGATTIAAGPTLAPRPVEPPPSAARERKPAGAASAPAPSPPPSPEPGPRINMAEGRLVEAAPPVSTARRIAAGLASTFLPRAVGEALGLVNVGGGRGLWLFVELDTLAFDVVLLVAAVHAMKAIRARRVTPTFVLLVLVFAMTAAPMVYAVTNFGTLFRLREMLYFIAAIAPLTLAARPARS